MPIQPGPRAVLSHVRSRQVQRQIFRKHSDTFGAHMLGSSQAMFSVLQFQTQVCKYWLNTFPPPEKETQSAARLPLKKPCSTVWQRCVPALLAQ